MSTEYQGICRSTSITEDSGRRREIYCHEMIEFYGKPVAYWLDLERKSQAMESPGVVCGAALRSCSDLKCRQCVYHCGMEVIQDDLCCIDVTAVRRVGLLPVCTRFILKPDPEAKDA